MNRNCIDSMCIQRDTVLKGGILSSTGCCKSPHEYGIVSCGVSSFHRHSLTYNSRQFKYLYTMTTESPSSYLLLQNFLDLNLKAPQISQSTISRRGPF